MNALRYNLVLYDKQVLLNFLEALAMCRGKNISQVLYAYILHDKDIIEETGELKKPHYHLWLEFPSSVKDRDLNFMLECCGGNASNISHQKTDRNFLAYLTHNTTNSTIKKQYDFKDIITNVEPELFYEWYFTAVEKVNKPSKTEKITFTIQAIMTACEDNINIINMASLMAYFIDMGELDIVEYISKRAYFINQLCKSYFKHNSQKLSASQMQYKENQHIEHKNSPKNDFKDENEQLSIYDVLEEKNNEESR